MTPAEASIISFVAHSALGQTRANGDPYFTHPQECARLVRQFWGDYASEITTESISDKTFETFTLDDLKVAALLHDVLEDTKLTRDDLLNLGVTRVQLDMIERLTKEVPDAPATPEYYQRISEHTGAMIVKCADRCSNLSDAYNELLVPPEKATPRRWARYVDKTTTDVIPLFWRYPGMRQELIYRVACINTVLPGALKARQDYVNTVNAVIDRPAPAVEADRLWPERCVL